MQYSWQKTCEQCGFLSLLRRGDELMADRGFTIEELLALLGVGLNTPPTLGHRSEMDGYQYQYGWIAICWDTTNCFTSNSHWTCNTSCKRVWYSQWCHTCWSCKFCISDLYHQCSPYKLSTSSTFLYHLCRFMYYVYNVQPQSSQCTTTKVRDKVLLLGRESKTDQYK